MLKLDRLTNLWVSALSKRPSSERVQLLVQTAGAALALLLLLAVGSGLFVSARLSGVERTELPALRESRELRHLLTATREALRGTDLEGDASRLVRADSLAERFHVVATEARMHPHRASAMRALDERFALYYVQARRSVQRLPSGDDAFTSSTELALVGERAVRGMLEADMAASEQQVAAELRSVRELQVASWVAMTLVVAVTILLLLSLGSALDRSMNEPMNRAAAAARAVADGASQVELPPTDDIAERSLHQALQRIASVQRDNALAAEALANGDRARVTGSVRRDPVGTALARIARYEEDVAEALRRVAAGDLSTPLEARSTQDSMGLAHAEIVGALAALLREIDVTAQSMAGTAGKLHDAAGQLATGAVEGAAGMRRSADNLARMTHDVRNVAIRAHGMEGRAAESAAAVQEGTTVLHESVGALHAVLREVSLVQGVAEDAGLLALNAAIEAARAGDEGAGFTVVAEEVRALAEQAGAAAREMTQLTAAGAASAARSKDLLERLVPSIDDSAALVRELTASTRQQAAALTAIEDEMNVATESTRRTASSAQHLAASAESLACHASRLGHLLKHFRAGDPRESPLALASA